MPLLAPFSGAAGDHCRPIRWLKHAFLQLTKEVTPSLAARKSGQWMGLDFTRLGQSEKMFATVGEELRRFGGIDKWLAIIC
jgi:hypothetical protein